jgi:hypothetical protein
VLPLTVTNMGLPGTVTVSTKTSDPSYTILTTAENTCQAGIAAGQSCTLPVKLTPDSENNHAGTLTLTTSAEGATTVVGLDGTGGAGVSFAGSLTSLPFTGLFGPGGIGVGSTGNVFLYDVGNLRVLELPRSATGYGPQMTLLAGGLQPFDGSLAGLAVDSAEDVFITDSGNSDGLNDGQVVVIPRAGNAYGRPYTLSIYNEEFVADSGNITAQPTGIAVESLGNIITTDLYNASLLELPRQGTGYGYGLVIGGTSVSGVAVDNAGDVLVTDQYDDALYEVPKTSTGYGFMTLPFNGSPYGVAVDNAGNLFVVDGDLLELPSTALGYGPQTTVLTGSFGAVATDSAGNIYVTQGNNVEELQRNSVNFGGANVCSHGTPAPCSQTLTFNYNINSNVTFGAPKILTGGKPSLDFNLGTGSTCTGTLTAGSSCTLNVIFAPLAAGTRNGTVDITDSDGNVRASTPVSGLGISPTGSPAAQVSTTYLPFGTVPFGTSETLPLTITNIGGRTLTVTPSISSYAPAKGQVIAYTIAGSTCGAGVTAGNNCMLQVQFTPASIGTYTDLLTLQTNGVANPTVGLHGAVSGLNVLGGVSGGKLQFGSVASGSTEVEMLTVTNVGLPGTVTVGTAITAGSTSGGPYTILTTAENTCLAGIAMGQSCTLPIEFAPTTPGVHNDLLILTPSAGGGETTVWLYGTTP